MVVDIFELHQSPLNTDIQFSNINICRPPSRLNFIFRDGAELCGMFCAIHNCIQQLQMDGDIDVFSTVRQLQIRRPEFCSSQVYIFSICGIMKEFVRSNIFVEIRNINHEFQSHFMYSLFIVLHRMNTA